MFEELVRAAGSRMRRSAQLAVISLGVPEALAEHGPRHVPLRQAIISRFTELRAYLESPDPRKVGDPKLLGADNYADDLQMPHAPTPMQQTDDESVVTAERLLRTSARDVTVEFTRRKLVFIQSVTPLSRRRQC